MKKYKSVLATIVLTFAGGAFCSANEDITNLINTGQYDSALPLLESQYSASPKNANVNYQLGMCLYKMGREKEAEKYLKFASSKNVAEAYHYLANIAFNRYQFQAAEQLMGTYSDVLSRSGRAITGSNQKDIDRVSQASQMLDHVEKIVIVDSISVDKEIFFNHYKISQECGTFLPVDSLSNIEVDNPTTVFRTENGERMMWGQMDEDGVTHLMQSVHLLDGSWEKPTPLPEVLDNDGNSNYPYMMPDGATLYYANDGKGSIGGLDIFCSRKDLDNGEYYQPQNIGFPYNSPYDDYLFVIDEFTGAGWWATDRNQIPGKVTIYTFIPNSMRVNYNIDDENLLEYAKVSSYRSTWSDDNAQAREDVANKIADIATDKVESKGDFEFVVFPGVIYTSFDQLKSSESRDLMEQYLNAKSRLEENLQQLQKLRKDYYEAADADKNAMKSSILQLESNIKKRVEEIDYLANSIRKREK